MDMQPAIDDDGVMTLLPDGVKLSKNIGRYFSALVISVARQGLFYVPLLFVLNSLWGEFGLYILQPVADMVAVVFAVTIVAFNWKKIFNF